jgi:hypothetical protein
MTLENSLIFFPHSEISYEGLYVHVNSRMQCSTDKLCKEIAWLDTKDFGYSLDWLYIIS